MTFAERNFVKSKELNKILISSLTTGSAEDFFYEFYYPDEIVTGNQSNVEVLSISRCTCLKPHNKQLNNLACSGFTVKFQNLIY